MFCRQPNISFRLPILVIRYFKFRNVFGDMMSKFNNGFTLVELVIVIAILAVLAGVAVPRFMEVQAQARGSKIIADMNTCESAINLYYTRNGHFPADEDIVKSEVVSSFLAAWPVPPVGRALLPRGDGTDNEITVVDADKYEYVVQEAGTELTTRVGRVTLQEQNLDQLIGKSLKRPLPQPVGAPINSNIEESSNQK